MGLPPLVSLWVRALAVLAVLGSVLPPVALSETAQRTHWHKDLDELRAKYKMQVLSDDPRVLLFEDFVTEAEGQALIDHGRPNLYRSTGGLEREVSQYRTSSNAWLTFSDVADKSVQHLIYELEHRIADVTNKPAGNQEHFQVLHYEAGQFYKSHHDYIPEHETMPCGVRAATFFLYLSNVTGGGTTDFPLLDISVRPVRGRALLWYNIDPATGAKDDRTEHIAQPVVSGEKWAANKWVHTDDFMDNWARGLTG